MDEQTIAAVDPRDEKIKELKERIKELEPHVPEATYAFNTNLVCGAMRGQWTMRARPGEEGKSFVFRVNAMLKYLGESGWDSALANLPPADLSSIGAPSAAPQPAQVAQSAGTNGGTLSIQATTLSATVADGKAFWKVKGGQFEKFGLTVYPEVLASAGLVNLDPMKTVSLVGWVADYTLKEDGKPGKVVRLHRPEHH